MTKALFHHLVRIVSVCCALLLFAAVLHAPSAYYWLLRTVISIGASLVIIKNIATTFWVLLFAIILVLFNPILPIFLYKKGLWAPIDILAGLLFLIEVIINRPKKTKVVTTNEKAKTFNRDRIL
ncbi:DUF6804 family protein [Maribacter sp. 2-571]|uniref:DUF6804 family protein n=1 Tax=Maribacter sp. 2-571 TaxID=3417569 RepID=UPI003D33EDE7